MNKVSLVLCAAVLLGPAQVLAEADGPDYWSVHGVARNDVLNLRAGANPHAEKVGEIPPAATCVRNLGCTGGLTLEEYTTLSEGERKALEKKRPRWCQVEYQGNKGWVAGRYLREGDCTDAADSHAEPMHIAGFRVDAGSERAGGDYQKDYASSVQNCADWCAREERCKAFDYHKDLEACWIKDRVPSARLNDKVVTGVKD